MTGHHLILCVVVVVYCSLMQTDSTHGSCLPVHTSHGISRQDFIYSFSLLFFLIGTRLVLIICLTICLCEASVTWKGLYPTLA